MKSIIPTLILTILLAACAPATPTESAPPTADAAAISTSAVQTVEARLTQEALVRPSETPTSPAATATPTAPPLPTVPTLTGGTPGKACLIANFIADVTIPDNTFIEKGQSFTKTWRVINNGSCPWDSTFKLVFVSGDSMGAATAVPLPYKVNPGQTVDISVAMVAPSVDGNYRGNWRLLTPWGGTIGFGMYDSDLYIKINVGTFAVQKVLYEITRSPAQGCDGNVSYLIKASILTNGPGTITYYWDRDDQQERGVKTLQLTSTETLLTTTYTFSAGDSGGTYQTVIFIKSPNDSAFYPAAEFTHSCP